MKIRAFDHIVLCVKDVAATRRFYERALNMESREERPGKWSLHFRANKISLQDAAALPNIARRTVPGSGNFCLLTDAPLNAVMQHLESQGIDLVDGPGERAGATGKILSVYFYDPDGNLVEVSNKLQRLERRFGARGQASLTARAASANPPQRSTACRRGRP